MKNYQILLYIIYLAGCASTDIYSTTNSDVYDSSCGYPLVIGNIAPLEDQGNLENALKIGFKERGINTNISIELLSPTRNLTSDEIVTAIVESGSDCILNISLREDSTTRNMGFDTELVEISTGRALWIAGINSTLERSNQFIDAKTVMFKSLANEITNDLSTEKLLSNSHYLFVGSWKAPVSVANWSFFGNGDIFIEQDGSVVSGYFNIVNGNRLIITLSELTESDGSTQTARIIFMDVEYSFESDDSILLCEESECIAMQRQESF